MRKQKGIIVVLLLLGIISVVLVNNVHAQEISAPSKNSIVKKIADKFGLKAEDVQIVFDEAHAERMAERHALFAEKLNDAVAKGTITQAQKDTILDKLEEFEGKFEEYRSLPLTERKAKMNEIHLELATWAKEQGIDIMSLGLMRMQGRGFKHGYWLND